MTIHSITTRFANAFKLNALNAISNIFIEREREREIHKFVKEAK